MRIGEAAGLYVEDVDLENGVVYVRRAIWEGRELEPKTENGTREIDIDETRTQMLKGFIGTRGTGRLFASQRGTPLAQGNLRRRVLTPLLQQLGIPKAGLHAFRHSRVTMLRKSGTPAELQQKWLGHSSLRTRDRYNHTTEELEYRKHAVARVGIAPSESPLRASV